MDKNLPKLPYGMGSYSYFKNKIRYKKRVNGKELMVYGDTIKEVNDKMKEKEKSFIKNQKKLESMVRTRTLEEGILQWMERYKMPEITAKSYDRIEDVYDSHIKDSNLGRMQEHAINSDDIQDFMTQLKPVRGNSLGYSSKKKIYEILNQYFRYLYDEDPTSNPMRKVTKPKKDNTIVKEEELIIWDDDEMKAIDAFAYEEYYNGVSGCKYGLLVDFLMWSFIRVGEFFALQWKDIDFKTGTVNIYKQISTVINRDPDAPQKHISQIVTPKKYSIRKFILPTPALNAIKEYKNRAKHTQPDDWICAGEDGKRFGESRIRQTYLRIKDNLVLDKNVTIHGLRHSGISYLIRHGVPIEVVSRNAGHRDISTTQNIYYSVIEAQKTDAMIEFNKKFK